MKMNRKINLSLEGQELVMQMILKQIILSKIREKLQWLIKAHLGLKKFKKKLPLNTNFFRKFQKLTLHKTALMFQ